MSDSGVDDISWGEGADEFIPAFFLGGSPGEQCGDPAVFVPDEILHHKAYWTVDPGEDGDIPHSALPDPQCALLPGDQPPHKFQIYDQIVLTVTHGSFGLQDLPVPHGLRQGSGRLQRGPVLKGV